MPEVVNTTPLSGFSALPDEPERETAIAVEDVSMIFNMANEQLNSLKEYAIALARKELRFKEFRALDGITLDIKKGDVFGILGTNGSGKSTLLKIIAGVLEPTKGTCTIHGNIAPLIELGAGFDMELTARENIYLNGALLGYSKKFIQDNFDDIVEFAEIKPFLDMPLKNYSSGMVARIAFAIATVIVPDILIVDEVLSVGDFMFQKKCEERIQSLIKEHNVTVLIVSHNNDQIERLCNKAVWIEKGHMRMLGTAHDVCQTYRVLGGHTGSKAAEERVFSMLTSRVQADESLIKPLEADSPYAMAARLSSSREEPADTVVVAFGEYEMDGFLGAGLAGALGAPVLLTQSDGIPDATSQEIKRLKARRIILVGKTPYCDADKFGRALQAATDARYDVETLSADTYEGLSFAVFDYGAQRDLWQGPAILTHIGCMGDMISLSPYASEQRCPLLIKSPGKPLSDGLIERIVSHGNDRLLVLDSEEGCPDAARRHTRAQHTNRAFLRRRRLPRQRGHPRLDRKRARRRRRARPLVHRGAFVAARLLLHDRPLCSAHRIARRARRPAGPRQRGACDRLVRKPPRPGRPNRLRRKPHPVQPPRQDDAREGGVGARRGITPARRTRPSQAGPFRTKPARNGAR